MRAGLNLAGSAEAAAARLGCVPSATSHSCDRRLGAVPVVAGGVAGGVCVRIVLMLKSVDGRLSTFKSDEARLSA